MEYLLTIQDFTSYQAILKDQDNNLIYWPKDKLPENAVIGQVISFSIEASGKGKEENLAKDILNQIFNDTP